MYRTHFLLSSFSCSTYCESVMPRGFVVCRSSSRVRPKGASFGLDSRSPSIHPHLVHYCMLVSVSVTYWQHSRIRTSVIWWIIYKGFLFSLADSRIGYTRGLWTQHTFCFGPIYLLYLYHRTSLVASSHCTITSTLSHCTIASTLYITIYHIRKFQTRCSEH